MSEMESIYQSEETRRALEFAAKAHEGQVRKYTSEPYITHPMAVAEMLLEHGVESEAMHIAALLHDTVEDTDVTHEDILHEFGEHVHKLVIGLTKLELPGVSRAKRKEIEALRLGSPPTVTNDRVYFRELDQIQTIKCLDLLHNMKSIVKHDPKFAKVFMREARVLWSVMNFAVDSVREELDNALWAYEGE